MNPPAPRRSASYRRVLLAVYWLADRPGLLCTATVGQLAAAAGRSARIVRRCLKEIEAAGIIATIEATGGTGPMTMILLDHPDAKALARAATRT